MKSIFKKSLMLVMVTGMVVAPVYADKPAFNHNAPLSWGERIFGENSARIQARAAAAEAARLVEAAEQAQLAADAAKAAQLAADAAKAAQAANVPAVSSQSRLSALASSIVSGIGSVLSWTYDRSIGSLLKPTTSPDNVVTNFVGSKTGYSQWIKDGNHTTVQAGVAATAKVVTALAVTYLGYKACRKAYDYFKARLAVKAAKAAIEVLKTSLNKIQQDKTVNAIVIAQVVKDELLPALKPLMNLPGNLIATHYGTFSDRAVALPKAADRELARGSLLDVANQINAELHKIIGAKDVPELK